MYISTACCDGCASGHGCDDHKKIPFARSAEHARIRGGLGALGAKQKPPKDFDPTKQPCWGWQGVGMPTIQAMEKRMKEAREKAKKKGIKPKAEKQKSVFNSSVKIQGLGELGAAACISYKCQATRARKLAANDKCFKRLDELRRKKKWEQILVEFGPHVKWFYGYDKPVSNADLKAITNLSAKYYETNRHCLDLWRDRLLTFQKQHGVPYPLTTLKECSSGDPKDAFKKMAATIAATALAVGGAYMLGPSVGTTAAETAATTAAKTGAAKTAATGAAKTAVAKAAGGAAAKAATAAKATSGITAAMKSVAPIAKKVLYAKSVVDAVKRGEAPPPPGSFDDKSLLDYAVPIASNALKEKLQRDLTEKEEKEMRKLMEAQQKRLAELNPELRQPFYSTQDSPYTDMQHASAKRVEETQDMKKWLTYLAPATAGLLLLAG